MSPGPIKFHDDPSATRWPKRRPPQLRDWIVLLALGVLLCGVLTEMARRLGVHVETPDFRLLVIAPVVFGFCVFGIREIRGET